MKYIAFLLVLLFTSCKFQYISFNSESDKNQAKITGNEYLKNLKSNNEITNFDFVSVENSKIIVGKKNDTLKEVYTLIYNIQKNTETQKTIIKIKKSKNNFDVKIKALPSQ